MATEADRSPGAADATTQPLRLPIADIGDIALADLFGRPGCPLCRRRRDASRRYLDAVLWESVNDPGFRERLETGRGFCRRHAHEVLAADRAQSGGSLGAAILLASAVRGRLDEMRRLPDTRGRRAREAVHAACAPAACPVCVQVAVADRIALGRLLARLAEPAWRSALAAAELCLDDLLRLWAAAIERRDVSWPEVATAQLERIEELAARLEAFAHHSSYDRRHLMTDAERPASGEAAAFLGGWPADDRR